MKLSQEEKHLRINDLLAIYNKTETAEAVAQKWAKRKGETFTVQHVKECFHLVKDRIDAGRDLHDLAENYGWSTIIWSLSEGTK